MNSEDRITNAFETTQQVWLHHVEFIRLLVHTADSIMDWTRNLIQRLENGENAMTDDTPEAL